MFDEKHWSCVKDALLRTKEADEFSFVGAAQNSMTWEQIDQRGTFFLVRLRLDRDGRVVMSWGWERVQHDAVQWRRNDAMRQPRVVSSDIHPKELVVPSADLLESIKHEVRRVAKFADCELKRQLEFGELRAVLEEITQMWSGYWSRPYIQEVHSYPVIPDLTPPSLDLTTPNQCVMTHGKRSFKLWRDEQSWRVDYDDVTSPVTTWRFVEEVEYLPGLKVIHSSDFLQQVLDTCAGL